MLTANGVTHPGRVRHVNEDAFFTDVDAGIFIVADGMGGHNAGEIASAMAIDTMRKFVVRTLSGSEFTWPFGVDPKLSFHANWLLTATKLANRRVCRESETRDEYTGMGTTLVAALIIDQTMTYSSVGDSRIYGFRDAVLEQLTDDDSWIGTLAAGDATLDRTTLATHPMRHVLTKTIGAREDIEILVRERPLRDGDRILLCSDGLHDPLESGTISDVLSTEPDDQRAAQRLVQAALETGGQDNITAVLIRYAAGGATRP